ncbi:MAG: CatB-related O-acetyltransferase [Opitutaceae bacterium]|nr:CatB-related O-acetyltransferase [Cytophagales bacterium]
MVLNDGSKIKSNVFEELKITYYTEKQKADFQKRKVTVMPGSFVSEDSKIGDYAYVGFNCFISKSNIGRYCSIANNVSIGNGEHLIDNISTSGFFYNDPYTILTKDDCNIGNDVWIGVDSIIRRGVTIGNGAIIGANSFVNKNVPDFAIVAGSPAKLIRYRFPEEKIEIIKEHSWWDLELDEATLEIQKIKHLIEQTNVKRQ